MPKLSTHSSATLVKLLYIGDSGTGKTGSLVSRVAAGYKLRILDLDNGLPVLVSYILEECPDKIDNVEYITLRDDIKAGQSGPLVSPKAFVAATKHLTKWDDDTSPSEWGPDTIFVLDSTTTLGKAAFEWAKAQNPSAKDPRQWFFAAQQAFENIIMMITSESFQTNAILIGHVKYEEVQEGVRKGYASAVGSALGPLIPRYFNTLVMTKTLGVGKQLRRSILTTPTAEVDLKNPAPFRIDSEYPLGSGLASIFEKLKAIS